MAKQLEDFGDVLIAVRNAIEPTKYENIALKYQYLPLVERWIKIRQPKVLQSGLQYTQPLKYREVNQTQKVTPHQDVPVAPQDSMINQTIPMRNLITPWLINELEMKACAGGDTQIFDLMKKDIADAEEDHLVTLEESLTGKPVNSSDNTSIWGLAYWIVYNIANSIGNRFVGGHPHGFSNIAGVDTSVYTKHKNWCGTYTAMTNADFQSLVWEAMDETNWMSPVPTPSFTNVGNKGDWIEKNPSRLILMDMETHLAWKTLLMAQNDNLGFDADPVGMKSAFRGNQVLYAPILNSATNPFYGTTNPVLMLNTDSFEFIHVKGEFLNRLPMTRVELKPRDLRTGTFTSGNIGCANRRLNAIFSK